jgi:hypothetical protein
VKGDAQALAEFEVVRYKAIVKEKFQARIPKNRISTTTRYTSDKKEKKDNDDSKFKNYTNHNSR